MWRMWPGSPQLEYEVAGCFLGGFVTDASGKPLFMLLSPAAPGSDAPAMVVVAPSATGEWHTVARLEDARDYHRSADGDALVGVEGTEFCGPAPSGVKTTLYKGDGLFGADLLPAGRGALLLERGAGGDTLSLVLANAGSAAVLVEDIADIPPEPELGGRPLAPCRVSPDGSKAAICGTRGGAPAVFVVDLASRHVTALSLDAGGTPGPAGVSGVATWAPAGDYLAVPGYGVFSIPAGERVVALGGGDTSPCWAGDGRHLLTGDAIITIPDGTRFPIVGLGRDLHLRPSAQVRPLGWAPAGAPGASGAPGAPAGDGPAAYVVVTWPGAG
ncbi:MAG: hypothetical protein K6T75_02390 [Acetobacteraceae bacterium]|nr:hypothetical protein [Acetobacteraceae bacterium]